MGKDNQVDPLLAPSTHSDLSIPNDTVLLQRSELIMQLDEKFQKNEGIQTIALVGIGGAGKTTLARQYARQQKANVVWEINAETNESLFGSFERLARVLSKTEEDQLRLRGLQEIKNSTERREKTIFFVKERLKLQQPWFLIYDNVENFSDVQNYFPQNSYAWGRGKIILTTRDSNIQNNNSVNQIIRIGELGKNQQLNLFMKIMNHGENGKIREAQREDVIKFLEQIPPFPLDISIAAYYLKVANISSAKYLEYISQLENNFAAVQEELLKEAGEYTKTRYSIITLSLKKLMGMHKDFGDLLLFISLLDSQKIPRELLDHYKNNVVVDNFIHHLKKYSLITNEASTASVGPIFSIHRSTQAIILAFLIYSS